MPKWTPRINRTWDKIRIKENRLRQELTEQPPPPPPEEKIPSWMQEPWVQEQIGQYQRLGQGADLGKAFGVIKLDALEKNADADAENKMNEP